MADFKIAFKKTISNEGGYANVAGDNGGETYAGVTRKNFPHWAGWAIVDKHKPLHNNQKINDAYLEALLAAFYKHEFWDALNLDAEQGQDLANESFDFAVNAGVGAALKLLKKI